LGNSTTKIN
jgi:chromosome segregation ATPase